MKTKIHLPMMFVLISAFVLVSACSKSSDDGTTADSSSTSASTVSATIEVYDGGSSTSRSLDRSVGFSSSSSRSTGNTFSDINKITVSVKEGQITHIDNQTLSKDSSDGRWKATLLNLPTSVTLTFSGDAYGSDNTTKTFSGTVSTSLSTSGTNIIGLTMYPVSNNTTQTFPTITSVLRPSSMNVGDNASIQIAVKGSTNETLNYFFGSGGGTFNPGQCTSLETSDNDVVTGICNSGSVDFTLSGTTGTIVSTYTAPTVIPSSGKVEHTIKVSNSQNNAVEVGFSITLTNTGASGSGTYSLEPRFAPVITGLSGRRGGTITDNGSSQLYVTWTANVNMVKNSDDNGSSNSNSVYWKANWAMSDNSSDNVTSICHPNYFSDNNTSCFNDLYYNNTQSSSSSSGSSPRTFAISLPAMMSYFPDNTTYGTLSLSITQGNGSSLSGGITTKIYYQIPLGLFPNNVIQ